MNNVELVWITPNAEALVAEMARVSNPKNQKNPSYTGLIKYLLDNNHWSPFETVAACFSINTSRRIAPQILRHRSFTFQEFCLSGDTMVAKIDQTVGETRPTPIKTMYAKQEWDNYKNIKVLAYNEATGLFIKVSVKTITCNGEHPLFKVTLANGNTIKCTKNHKFLTETQGFQTLEDIVGLTLLNDKALVSQDGKVAARKRKFAEWVEITDVEYAGIEMTYDLEIDHPSHNYIANNIIVHNSTRYAAVEGFVDVNPRSQDLKNRQSSHDDLSPEIKEWFQNTKLNVEKTAMDAYQTALSKGIAKESAAFLLPMSATTHMYIQGTLRSYIHYINLRTDPATQLEHRELAEEMKQILIKEVPNIALALDWKTK